ncbi:hypothetical protein FAI41_08175 [Acetobacteraceae bacterium]|nr:hypothetical protein FAI41_08175 [Acetobacteraceae bacterium]
MFNPTQKKMGLLLGSTLLILTGCDTNPVRDVHPLTNIPFASSYPIGEDGSSHYGPARSKSYCADCGLRIPRPTQKTSIARGPDGEPL